MKKVLIFWLWFQWRKYYNYFISRWFEVFWVTKTSQKKDFSNSIKYIYKFSDLIKFNKSFFKKFDLIIISVYPYNEQERVIKFILLLNLPNKTIIEKPVSIDLKLMETLLSYNNITFFIDEVFLSSKFIDIKIDNAKIITYNDLDFFEHAFWLFLLRKDFKSFLNKVELFFVPNKINFSTTLYFYMRFWIYDFKSENGHYYINWKVLNNNIFDLSLKFFLYKVLNDFSLNYEYKNNFLNLRKFFNNKNWYV